MHLITTTNINEALSKIQSMFAKKQTPIAVLSQDDEFNRKILENKKVSLLIINENLHQRDYMKQRNSGLNEITAEIARKNNIKIGIDTEAIISKNPKEQALSIARLKQNIMLCKRAGTEIVFLIGAKGKSDKLAFQSLLLVLGASTSLSKKAAEASFFK